MIARTAIERLPPRQQAAQFGLRRRTSSHWAGVALLDASLPVRLRTRPQPDRGRVLLEKGPRFAIVDDAPAGREHGASALRQQSSQRGDFETTKVVFAVRGEEIRER